MASVGSGLLGWLNQTLGSLTHGTILNSSFGRGRFGGSNPGPISMADTATSPVNPTTHTLANKLGIIPDPYNPFLDLTATGSYTGQSLAQIAHSGQTNVNPGSVIQGSGILNSFPNLGLPGAQLLANGYHVVDQIYTGTRITTSNHAVGIQSIADGIPPGADRMFAKSLLTVGLGQRIDMAQWIAAFQAHYPGVSIAMVGQPNWGETIPPLYGVGNSGAYDLSWSPQDLAIIKNANAFNVAMPGSLYVTLTYTMGTDGAWHLTQIFLHFWPNANISQLKNTPTPQPVCVGTGCNPQIPQAQPSNPGILAGLANSQALQALIAQKTVGSLLSGSVNGPGTANNPSGVTVIDGTAQIHVGSNLTAEQTAAIAANLSGTWHPTVQSNGLVPQWQAGNPSANMVGLMTGTNSLDTANTYTGVGTGLASNAGQLLAQTVLRP